MSDEPIGTGEFTRAMASLERQMQAGFDRSRHDLLNVSRGLHKRLDRIDDRANAQGEDIVRLQEHKAAVDKRHGTGDNRRRGQAAKWGGAAATLIWVIELIRQAVMTGGQ